MVFTYQQFLLKWWLGEWWKNIWRCGLPCQNVQARGCCTRNNGFGPNLREQLGSELTWLSSSTPERRTARHARLPLVAFGRSGCRTSGCGEGLWFGSGKNHINPRATGQNDFKTTKKQCFEKICCSPHPTHFCWPRTSRTNKLQKCTCKCPSWNLGQSQKCWTCHSQEKGWRMLKNADETTKSPIPSSQLHQIFHDIFFTSLLQGPASWQSSSKLTSRLSKPSGPSLADDGSGFTWGTNRCHQRNVTTVVWLPLSLRVMASGCQFVPGAQQVVASSSDSFKVHAFKRKQN